ncbi:hypothetical protein DPMN_102617 [Dreissena polymorpha]|uniref:Uncharacterized protein n=1 Tax=Dreissena polymorpha TaxID=45954 RepID=A0A9D4LL96_DREPO|nr:hypothetical protein DPMN_102617 [Dreissena polymorpha]
MDITGKFECRMGDGDTVVEEQNFRGGGKLQRARRGFTLHKLANMRRTGVGKPRPLLDQEKLDLFRDAPRKGHDSIIVAKKFDRLVADVERKMRAALRRLKEMTGLD